MGDGERDTNIHRKNKIENKIDRMGDGEKNELSGQSHKVSL